MNEPAAGLRIAGRHLITDIVAFVVSRPTMPGFEIYTGISMTNRPVICSKL